MLQILGNYNTIPLINYVAKRGDIQQKSDKQVYIEQKIYEITKDVNPGIQQVLFESCKNVFDANLDTSATEKA